MRDPARTGRRLAGRVRGGATGLATGLGDVARGVGGQARWPDQEVARVQRRTLATLVLAQSLGGVAITIGIAVASILAEDLSGSQALAGTAQTMQVLGAALASFALATVMGRRGRRAGLLLGYLLGAVGGALCVVAGVVGSFALLLLGATLLGATTAANGQSRYVATDLAVPERRARALSLVLWATTVGAVAGPNLTGPAGGLAHDLGLPRLVGPFGFAVLGVAGAGAVVAVFLRPDPLVVAREAALARTGVSQTTPTGSAWRRAASAARSRTGVAAGVTALALAHAVMVAVMVMTPLHMHHGGAALEVVGLVISVHVLGMFAFAPLVGWAADRFGRPAVLGSGAATLLLSLVLAGTAPEGASIQIGVGLFLLGLGWSQCTVAASALLSESAPLAVRTDVQGTADLVMGLVAAAGGVVAGVVMAGFGFLALNLFAALLVTGVATAAELARRAGGGRPAATADPAAPEL